MKSEMSSYHHRNNDLVTGYIRPEQNAMDSYTNQQERSPTRNILRTTTANETHPLPSDHMLRIYANPIIRGENVDHYMVSHEIDDHRRHGFRKQEDDGLLKDADNKNVSTSATILTPHFNRGQEEEHRIYYDENNYPVHPLIAHGFSFDHNMLMQQSHSLDSAQEKRNETDSREESIKDKILSNTSTSTRPDPRAIRNYCESSNDIEAPPYKRQRCITNEYVDTSTLHVNHHRDFVRSIFSIGLKNSSPAVIVANMTVKHPDVTSERVKSHLQKFRLHETKSKEEFMSSYDNALLKYQECKNGMSSVLGSGSKKDDLPISEKDILKVFTQFIAESKSGQLFSGEVAAYLTTAITHDIKHRNPASSSHNNAEHCQISADDWLILRQNLSFSTPTTSFEASMSHFDATKNQDITSIVLPQLQDEEKNSSLGHSLCFVMGLFFSIKQHILDSRKKNMKCTNVDSV